MRSKSRQTVKWFSLLCGRGGQGSALKETGDHNFFLWGGEGAMNFDRLWLANGILRRCVGKLNQLCSILKRGQKCRQFPLLSKLNDQQFLPF